MADVKIHRRYSGDRHHVNNHSFDDSAHDWSSDENEEVIYSEKDARLPDIEEHDANDVAGLEEIDGDDPMNGDKHYGKHARQRGDHHRDVRFLTEGEMLDQSAAELKATIDELEKRFDSIENEGNEWKTRYETQQEMNQQLERQIILLQNKVEEARHNLKEANKTPRDNRNFDDLSDASPQMVKALDREKQLLHNQLRDLEWRLDQESKAYHKANDERKQYVLEINAAKGSISEMKTRQRQALMAPGQPETGSSPRTYRDNAGNIPDDQRIIDPRRGPIKRTAGVKSLPSLEAL
ncbi:hypothetical protein C0Q70_05677 [Pomacea canaliculata]|uniref:Uncharacterized protein n=1 Tax=Pomacea canaliculata TaxID=400727 RepID=A0A2T7PLU9_POMCA|nr:coiled-coil domain-containing protein 169-like isoform X1 [Pomacea canaliculata]XP_025086235.1 coiled-coil domain-containing protein 169-like isoform X1 [Pomacea canaliculata]PVD34405.1 hypothetical protein C0Q70_05677 [Pomacea canaliculata]